MFVRTPGGGIHAWWFLKPVRATVKAVRLYTALQSSLAAELGADTAAVGAERLWRLPTAANVIYSSKRKYKLSVLLGKTALLLNWTSVFYFDFSRLLNTKVGF